MLNLAMKIQNNFHSVVAGLGDEDETLAWVTEKHLKTESMRMYALMEVMKYASKFPSDRKWK